MPSNVSGALLSDAKHEIRGALKVVPSAFVITILWFFALRQVFSRWTLVSSLTPVERQSLAFIMAAPLALITYFLGGYWDDRIFDTRYGEDPRRQFRGKWLDTSRRNCFGLLPAGTDLDLWRQRAAAALQLYSVEGVYSESKRKLQGTKEWARAERLLYLSKLCRSLIWPCFLLAAGLLTNVAIVLLTQRQFEAESLIGAVATLMAGLLLLVPYINLRVEHMLELYSHVGAPKA